MKLVDTSFYKEESKNVFSSIYLFEQREMFERIHMECSLLVTSRWQDYGIGDCKSEFLSVTLLIEKLLIIQEHFGMKGRF